jgi:tRNA threonylcarbamoyladenosine biosynthesis protein TsaB
MGCILNIETSTDVCSIAVSQDGACLFERTDHSGPNHAVKLGLFVDEALAYIDCRDIHLDAVAVSCGPGSYTGLCIGVSMAKGICFGRDAKLIAVPTLELLCVPVLLEAPSNLSTDGETIKEPLLCPMLDARRMEVYAQIFDYALNEIRPIQADVVDAKTYKAFLDEHPVYFFGNGAAKCMDTIQHPNAHLIKDIEPLARNMMPLAEKRMMQGRFEDVAYFVPFYLKDFVAKQAKKLI